MGITATPSVGTAAAAANAAGLHPPGARQTPPPANPTTDTVQLTEAERVYQLYNQGQQVPQIASSLSLTAAAVNSYLSLSTKSS